MFGSFYNISENNYISQHNVLRIRCIISSVWVINSEPSPLTLMEPEIKHTKDHIGLGMEDMCTFSCSQVRN